MFNYLDIIPYRVHKEEIDENGLVTVLIPSSKENFVNDILTGIGKPA